MNATEVTTNSSRREYSTFSGDLKLFTKSDVTQSAKKSLKTVTVRFAHWQVIPDALVVRHPEAVWRGREKAWAVQMFTLLADAGSRVAGGTVSLASLVAEGVVPNLAPVCNSDLDAGAGGDCVTANVGQLLAAAAVWRDLLAEAVELEAAFGLALEKRAAWEHAAGTAEVLARLCAGQSLRDGQ